MKTLAELETMSKAELDAYAEEQFGVALDARRTKAQMIEDLLASPVTEEGDAPPAAEEGSTAEPAAEEVSTPEPSAETVRLTITEAPTSPDVVLHINGARFALQVNKPITVPVWVVPTLEAVAGVRFTKE